MKKWTLLLLVVVLAQLQLDAQSISKIVGQVVDEKSTPISGASIKVLNTSKGAVSNAGGEFVIDGLFDGTYILQVSAIGYATITKEARASSTANRVLFTLAATTKQLDEVVVSAEKREEVLQQSPLSVTGLSAKQVEQYRLWNIKDITAIAPNMYAADPGDKRNVTSIRGITTTSYDPAIATYIDGVNQFSLDTYISPLFDVERIEVLRGPQGTLYGRNAMGGVINIITKQPTNKTEAFAEVSLGNYGQQRYSIGVKAPVVKDKLFIGAAGLYDAFEGFYTNKFNNSKYDKQHSIAGNYYLKFLPGKNWDVTLNAKHNNNRNNGPFPLIMGTTAAFKNPYELSQNAVTKIVDNVVNASLSINHTGRTFNFSSQSSYQSNYRYYTNPIDADFSPIDGITINSNYGKDWNNVKVYTQEFKFTNPTASTSSLKWTAGTYLFYNDNPVKQATHFGKDARLVGSPDINYSLINTTKATASGVAVYGQLNYSISSKLDLTGGLRYDNEYKKQSVLGEYQKDPNPVPVFQFRSDTSASAHFNAFSPKLGINYHFTTNNILFTTYSKGFRAGGLTPLSADPSQPALFAFKPEYSNNFELGVKNQLVNNRVLLNVTAFYSTITNAQVPTLVLPDAVTITRNTGKLTSKGLEAELSANVIKGLELNYSVGYTNAKYDELRVSENGREVNLKGNKQIFTPDVTSMLALQYSYQISSRRNLNIVLRGEWKYLGKQYFDLANTIAQSSYGLVNTRIGIAAKKFSIFAWGRNVADKRYISYAYDFGAVHLGDPARFGVTLAAHL